MFVIERMKYARGEPEGYFPISPIFKTKDEANKCLKILIDKEWIMKGNRLHNKEIRIRELKPVIFLDWLKEISKWKETDDESCRKEFPEIYMFYDKYRKIVNECLENNKDIL